MYLDSRRNRPLEEQWPADVDLETNVNGLPCQGHVVQDVEEVLECILLRIGVTEFQQIFPSGRRGDVLRVAESIPWEDDVRKKTRILDAPVQFAFFTSGYALEIHNAPLRLGCTCCR